MESSPQRVRRRRIVYVLIAVALGGVLLVLLPGLRHPVWLFFPGTWKPPRPDLTNCTRLEIQFRPSILQSFFGNDMKRGLLSAEEQRYLGSLKSIVLTDPNVIQALADEVAGAEFKGLTPKPDQPAEDVLVSSYIGSKLKASFILWGSELQFKTRKGYYIFYNRNFPFCLQKLRPQVRPFENRIYCALRLQMLYIWIRDEAAPGNTYRQPAEWCEAMERDMRAHHRRENDIKWAFTCPCVRKGRCHYAMNPDCRPDSPPDTVLLFETKAGWNQHGGPELFTFDNHDPKGGLVLFNNGAAKFIRTEEELKQLRWK